MPAFVVSLSTLAQMHWFNLHGLLLPAVERPALSSTPAGKLGPPGKSVALELATSIFTCPTKPPYHWCPHPSLLIGPEAAAHRCDCSSITFCSSTFSTVGARAVAQMLWLLALDRSTAMSAEMDGLLPT